MKHLIIQNLGPLRKADVELHQFNVIIGPQSMGKSCVLKTACFCSWLEKRIEMLQSTEFVELDHIFANNFVVFHKLNGYVRNDTYFSYETEEMFFCFEGETGKFKFHWNDDRWNYRRPKISYIPSERNIVGAVPNWFDVKFKEDNIRNFIRDWEEARKYTEHVLPILNLGVSYKYIASSKSDKVKATDGTTLNFTNTSSGLQSLIPLFVHLNYLYKNQLLPSNYRSSRYEEEKGLLMDYIYNELFEKKGKCDFSENKFQEKMKKHGAVYSSTHDRMKFFSNEIYANEYDNMVSRLVDNQFCDIYLEEPEQNLFPPTQAALTEWLIDMSKENHDSRLCIATHSPYLLTCFLEKTNIDLALFFVNKEQKCVRTASQEDIQAIYDDGFDAFFNIESFNHE